MQKYFLVFITLIIISGCSVPDKNAIPADVILPAKMEDIIYDMHLAEGLITNQHVPYDSISIQAKGYYQSIYQKHQVTEKDFAKSIEFYTSHPTLLDSIYQGVIIQLTEFESSIIK